MHLHFPQKFNKKVHNYAKVKAHFDDSEKLIYFEANEHQIQANSEFILPIDEKIHQFRISLIQKIINRINELHSLDPKINK